MLTYGWICANSPIGPSGLKLGYQETTKIEQAKAIHINEAAARILFAEAMDAGGFEKSVGADGPRVV